MKKTFISFTILLAATLVFTGCKKENDTDEDDDCPITVEDIAGKYKLFSVVLVEASGQRDVMHEIYEDCELDDINELKADKTFVYTDGGSVCSPSGSTSGTWNISGRILTLNSGTANIESFNCRDLVVTYRNGDDLIKETYRKQ